MKRILIAGKDSYIGMSVEKWLMRPEYAGMYQVDTADMRDDKWRGINFSGYDAVFHVAGIAHVDIGKTEKEDQKQYYAVNCDLAFEAAKKAKEEGVKQFIFMSSIIIYGEDISLRKKRVITRNTAPMPSTFYGDSKWRAEQKLTPLNDTDFHVALLRAPMIYGSGCKGNYRLLRRIALSSPFFPDFPNERSALYIGNLCEYVRRLVDSQRSGIFFPQDSRYIRTSGMVKQIAGKHGKKIILVKGFNWVIVMLAYAPGKIGRMVNKAFGSLVYEKGIDISFSGIDDKPV